MKFAWFTFWIRVAYWLRLRWPFIWVQRWLKGELDAHRAPLPTDLTTPDQVAVYVNERFQYRKDEGRLGGWVFPLDWVTDPQVFQFRLESSEQRDGDCDDFHFWAATMVARCPGVDQVYLLSSGYEGGGHTTAVYRYEGQWFHFDYRIHQLADPNDAPQAVANRYTKGDAEPVVTFVVFETIDPPWRAAAIGRDKVPA